VFRKVGAALGAAVRIPVLRGGVYAVPVARLDPMRVCAHVSVDDS